SGIPCQTFRAVFPGNIVVDGLTTQGTWGATHTPPIITTAGDVRVFAGPREDPVSFDLVGFERSIAAASANVFTGFAAFKGRNAKGIVVEFPMSMVFPALICQGTFTGSGISTPCGAWAVTSGHQEHQIDRLANPLLTVALIPLAQKDSFNAAQPKHDAKNFLDVIKGQIIALDTRFGTCQGAGCNPNIPFLTSVFVPDTLKFAVNIPDGYPNGRRLFDRVYDVLLSLILQLPGFTDGTSAKHYCLPSPDFPGDPTA